MHASDIAIALPIVDRNTSALKAAKLIAASDVGGLIVANLEGQPVGVVATVDILRLLLPSYLREDLSLAAVVDEKGAEELWTTAASRTLGELIDDDAVRMPDIIAVDEDATIVEIAA
ncbi:MAG: CBS domain-containing protein, partial [Rhodoglobus sp.]|nr:CBS domain-containing protein [Rhodoglobus sp.]